MGNKTKHKTNFVAMTDYLSTMETRNKLTKEEDYNIHCTNFRYLSVGEINWENLKKLEILTLDGDFYTFNRYGKNSRYFQNDLKDWELDEVIKLMVNFKLNDTIYKCLTEEYPEEIIKDTKGMPLDLLYYTYSKHLEEAMEKINEVVLEIEKYKAKLFEYAIFEYPEENKDK